MRRNLKVILLMAIVWAGGLVYLVKNGDKPPKQVRTYFDLKILGTYKLWSSEICENCFGFVPLHMVSTY